MKLVKYFKNNCPNCQTLDFMAMANGIFFDEKVLLDGEIEKARSLKIMSVPVVVLYDANGAEVSRMTGTNADDLVKLHNLKGA